LIDGITGAARGRAKLTRMRELYLGLISGTSVDGVDAVLCELDATACRILAAATTPLPPALLERVRRLIEAPQASLREVGTLDHALGRFFAACSLDLIASAGLKPTHLVAIGHHGQTVYHHPDIDAPFTMQLGDPNLVAALTGVTTVADFRRVDMALGGQGAPLVPAFHAWQFGAADESRVVVNIGGIANITVLAPGRPVTGFDTGPGNTLLDLWIRRCRTEPYDRDGRWAAGGHVDLQLLDSLLREPFFRAPPPKSTGRELFHMAWLEPHLATRATADANVQATLAELTAATIVAAIEQSAPDCRRLIVCGGGAHNADLLARIAARTSARVVTSDAHGISPDWIEGAAFAWLARARLHSAAGNVATVTGARRAAVLGGVYWGPAPKTVS
jgi:anhydro-N-acetylmuramic acid kinase